MVCRIEAVSKQLNALNVEYAKNTDRIMVLRDRKREQPDEQVKKEIQLEIDEVVTEKQELNLRIVSLEQLYKRAQGTHPLASTKHTYFDCCNESRLSFVPQELAVWAP